MKSDKIGAPVAIRIETRTESNSDERFAKTMSPLLQGNVWQSSISTTSFRGSTIGMCAGRGIGCHTSQWCCVVRGRTPGPPCRLSRTAGLTRSANTDDPPTVLPDAAPSAQTQDRSTILLGEPPVIYLDPPVHNDVRHTLGE